MGRRQTMMEKYKIQMKAYRKKRMKADSTPFSGAQESVYVMDSLNPEKRIKVMIKKTVTRNQRQVIDSLACPECGADMYWDNNWEAFICTKHGKRAIYELAP